MNVDPLTKIIGGTVRFPKSVTGFLNNEWDGTIQFI